MLLHNAELQKKQEDKQILEELLDSIKVEIKVFLSNLLIPLNAHLQVCYVLLLVAFTFC